jgi:hypothetical protein
MICLAMVDQSSEIKKIDELNQAFHGLIIIEIKRLYYMASLYFGGF